MYTILEWTAILFFAGIAMLIIIWAIFERMINKEIMRGRAVSFMKHIRSDVQKPFMIIVIVALALLYCLMVVHFIGEAVRDFDADSFGGVTVFIFGLGISIFIAGLPIGLVTIVMVKRAIKRFKLRSVYPGLGKRRAIELKYADGSVLFLKDGSEWEIAANDRAISRAWSPTQEIFVTGNIDDPDHPYRFNSIDGIQHVKARLLSH